MIVKDSALRLWLDLQHDLMIMYTYCDDDMHK
jgi:hypothetical protein